MKYIEIMFMNPKLCGFMVLIRYDYIAISKDKASMIQWSEEKDNYNTNVSKRYYIRLPKEEFLPKSVNHDFLND